MDARAKWSVGLLGVAVALLLGGGLASCDNDLRRGVCLYAGVSYAAQERFVATDDCNTCTCQAEGGVACTERACGDGGAVVTDGAVVRDGSDGSSEASRDTLAADGAETETEAAPGVCSLETAYRFYDDGGLRAFYDDSRIAPPRLHTLTRKSVAGGTMAECGYEIPCSPGGGVELASIQKAIAHADVQEAMAKAQRPHYGSDPRPVDGTIWVFERSDGRGFSVGGGNVPAGLRALETVLRQLTTETRAAPQCAALRP